MEGSEPVMRRRVPSIGVIITVSRDIIDLNSALFVRSSLLDIEGSCSQLTASDMCP